MATEVVRRSLEDETDHAARARRRSRSLVPLLSVVVCGMVAMGCSRAADPLAGRANAAARPVDAASASPSPAVQDATLSATAGYRRFTVEHAQRFVADSEALASAIASGDAATAKSDETAAQAEFDDIRPQVAGGGQTALDLDGQANQFPPGTPFTGLHRIEEALWTGTTPGGAPAALVAAGPAVEFSVARTILTPQSIIRAEVQELDWVEREALTGQEEQFSHLDAVDVDAGVTTARTGFTLVQGLGELLAVKQTYLVADRFRSLTEALTGLGVIGADPDSAIPTAAWRAVGQQVDATASAMAVLASELGSATTGAGYGSYGRY